MLEKVRTSIERLIALYEGEKQRAKELGMEIERKNAEMDSCRKQIADLERQVDNLKLMGAFTGGENSVARERINRMIADIDKCISLLEN